MILAIDHLGRPGQMIKVNCDVTFRFFIPAIASTEDEDSIQPHHCLIIVSDGIHKHSLPVPSQVPKQIVSDLFQVAKTIGRPGSALSKHLRICE